MLSINPILTGPQTTSGYPFYHQFVARCSSGYARGIVAIPEGSFGQCEIRDQFDKEYIYQALYLRGEKIDSNDPQLLGQHVPFIRAARGSIRVTNVGLGGFLYRLVRNPAVFHITVIEPNYDILELVEPAFSKHIDKVTFVHGNLVDIAASKQLCAIYPGNALAKI